MSTQNKRDTWRFVFQLLMAILSAVATSIGVSSCM